MVSVDIGHGLSGLTMSMDSVDIVHGPSMDSVGIVHGPSFQYSSWTMSTESMDFLQTVTL